MDTCWATGSWAANTWAANTWAVAVTIAALFGDLCTMVMNYLPTIRNAALNPALDSTSLLSKQIATWRGADTFTDTNVVMARALS